MTKRTETETENARATSLIRRLLMHGILPAWLALGACGSPGDMESEPPADTPRAIAEAECDVAGIWKLEESLDASRGCGDRDAGWAPFVDAWLEVSQPGELVEIAYVPEEGAAMSCSGVLADDRCALEMTCSGTVRDEETEASLHLTFDPENGKLSGTRTLDIIETGCSTTVSIDGTRNENETRTDGG